MPSLVRSSRSLFSIAAFVALAGSNVLSLAADAAERDAPQSRIVGGVDAKPCAWPGQVMMIVQQPNGSRGTCTGTLVHPKLVLYSAHCGVPEQLIFGEKVKDSLHLLEKDIESYKVNPDWRSVNDIPQDFAYVVLKEPLTALVPTPVAVGCERAEGEKRGHPICMAGYSANNTDDSEQVYLRWGRNKIGSLRSGTIEIFAGTQSATACSGDSGGPLLHKLPDGSWRTMGITSTLQGSCGSPSAVNRYTHITPRVLDWIEKNSGIDIAPCVDSDGKPTPSAACDALMAYAGDPSNPQGKRSDVCKAAKAKPARAFCKIPKSEDNSESGSSTTQGEGSDSSTEEESSTGEGSSPDQSNTDSGEQSSSEEETGSDESQGSQKKNSNSKKGDSTPEEDSKKTPKSGKSKTDLDPQPPSKGGCRLDNAYDKAPGMLLFSLIGLGLLRRRSRR